MSTNVLRINVPQPLQSHETSGIEVLVPALDDESISPKFTWDGETLNPGVYIVKKIHLNTIIDGRESTVLEVVRSGSIVPTLFLNVDNGNIRDLLAKQGWIIPI